MSERLRTWHYLCDICTHCSEVHIEHIGTGDYECAKYGLLDLRKAISDAQYPHEVCDCFAMKDNAQLERLRGEGDER